ncbi:ATP-grasp domain-containing protein [Lactobacillus sp. 3B(2020)]|uniref:ATP-grasp domain-containing protein n=1 Tax=Lactobacillus sp. 3B(2020) TaxID=2695882 RepID=UPI0015DF8C7B|nr:ATP-grasp domain-containing protein [Lactobacillus sp. 3B(2020)]QLL70468.1 ATP-grasp domain-containing protein [Lactobacillus sp. 3B(2020)]
MAGTVLAPGQTLGIIGFDHNGLAMLNTAHELGLKVYAYVDQPHPELTNQADYTMVGNYRDKEKLMTFGEACDAVIYETANIDAIIFKYLSKYTLIPQGIDPLEIMQDRLMERAFLDQINVNIAPYVTVISLEDVYQSIDSIGYPAVLKPIQRGIGEESMIIWKESDIARAANFMVAGTYLLESWIDHSAEYAMTVAVTGNQTVIYPVAKMQYTDDRELVGVQAPIKVADDLEKEMERISKATVNQLGYQGILTLEFYVTDSGSLYVKGIEPGIITAGNVFTTAANITPAAQQVRIICGMPAHQVFSNQLTIMMLTRPAQLKAVLRQRILKDNWSFNFFVPQNPKPDQVVGLTWITGTANQSLRSLSQQVEATSVWATKADAEPEAE